MVATSAFEPAWMNRIRTGDTGISDEQELTRLNPVMARWSATPIVELTPELVLG
jgi:hypothetical protein